MKKTILVFFASLILFLIAGTSVAQETSRFDFVSEFISELGAMENLRAAAEQEAKEANNNPALVLPSAIHYSTQVQLELRTRISKLNSMHLNPPFETLPGAIENIYKQKIELHDAMIDIATQFMSGPKQNTDYGGLAAKMPQIRALLENEDKTILESVTPMVFFTLLDEKPDANGQLTYLSITKKQRQQLLSATVKPIWFKTRC